MEDSDRAKLLDTCFENLIEEKFTADERKHESNKR